jgi:hypothetical protein
MTIACRLLERILRSWHAHASTVLFGNCERSWFCIVQGSLHFLLIGVFQNPATACCCHPLTSSRPVCRTKCLRSSAEGQWSEIPKKDAWSSTCCTGDTHTERLPIQDLDFYSRYKHYFPGIDLSKEQGKLLESGALHEQGDFAFFPIPPTRHSSCLIEG